MCWTPVIARENNQAEEDIPNITNAKVGVWRRSATRRRFLWMDGDLHRTCALLFTISSQKGDKSWRG